MLRPTRPNLDAVSSPETQPEFGIRSLIEQQVGRQFQQFELELLRNFQRVTEHIAQENARAIASQFENRLQMLESMSARQAAVLARLSAPGQLAYTSPETSETAPPPASFPASFRDGAVPVCAEAAFLFDESDRGNAMEYPSLHCPRCTSRHIRRATRANSFEQLLRLVGVAPFRCRSCRHKFYRFRAHHQAA